MWPHRRSRRRGHGLEAGAALVPTIRIGPTKTLSWIFSLPGAVAAAVVARAGYVVVLAGTKLSDDEINFWTIAGNVVHGRGFSYEGRATAWRPPLYTYLVAVARWVGASGRLVQLGQAGLGAATPAVLYALTRRLGCERRTSIVAAWVGAIYPPFVYFSGRILSENVAIPLYLLALLATVEWYHRRSRLAAVWCGAAWGLSILGRPTGIPLVLVVVIVAVVGLAGWRTALAQGLVVVIVAAAFVVPWMVRNASAVGGYEPVTSNEGVTLWAPNRLDTNQLKNVFRDPHYPGLQDYSVYGRAFPGIEPLARRKGFDFAHASEAAQDRWLRGLAVADIRSDPARFALRTMERTALTLLPAPDNASQTAKTPSIDKVALWFTSGPVVALGMVGLFVMAWRARRRAARAAVAWMLLAVGVVSLVFTAAHLPYVRYRVAGLDPVLIPAAAWMVFESWRRRGAVTA